MFQRVQAVTPPDALMTGARFMSVCGLPLEALTLPLTQLASPPICVAQSEVSADHGPSGFLELVKYDCGRKHPAVSRLEMGRVWVGIRQYNWQLGSWSYSWQ